jgi:hypothetical protein
MLRRQIQRSGEAMLSPDFASVAAAAITGGVASIEIAASPMRPCFDPGSKDVCSQSPSATSLQAAAPILARRAGGRSADPPSAASASAEADVETSEGPRAPKPAPLDGDLIRRRWRSLIGRHPPKTMSHALMDRILAWREQVAEVGDISPRSRAILVAALAGKAAGTGKDGQLQDTDNKGGHDGRRHRPHTPIRLGTALFRAHAGVLHRVTVVAEGFEWEGRTYASLSAVARAITGVRWNGRRFFALDRGARHAVACKVSEQGAGAPPPSREPNELSRAGGGL